MFEVIFTVLTFIKQIGYLCFAISFKTGQTIVGVLNSLFGIIVNINTSFQTLIKILFEDFNIFWSDVAQLIFYIWRVVEEVVTNILSICSTFKVALLNVVFGIVGIYDGIFNGISKIFTALGYAVVTVKHYILLLGSGIWFAVTLIPLFIVYLCTMTAYYIGCLSNELLNITSSALNNSIMIISDGYNFITDVPLDSLAGLLSGCCIIFVVFKLQMVLYQKLLLIFELIKRTFSRLQVQRLPHIHVDQSSSESDETESSDTSEEEPSDRVHIKESVCIICHERNRCILLLPCRHICLCQTCNMRLQNYNRTCPLCRTVIERTMKVFV